MAKSSVSLANASLVCIASPILIIPSVPVPVDESNESTVVSPHTKELNAEVALHAENDDACCPETASQETSTPLYPGGLHVYIDSITVASILS